MILDPEHCQNDTRRKKRFKNIPEKPLHEIINTSGIVHLQHCAGQCCEVGEQQEP
jgi:hypothetical protein